MNGRAAINVIVICFGIYIALLIGKTLLYVGEIKGPWDLLRPVIRIAVFACCIWGLLRFEKWAWWMSFGFSAFYSVLGIVGFTGLLFAGMLSELHPVYIAYIIVLIATLAVPSALLLMPSTRSQFF